MKDWLDQPLSALGNNPALVKARHDQLSLANAPYIANGCMRSLRAIYNHARKTARTLPVENPVLAVDWNSESRRDTALGPSDLGGWFGKLAKVENPLRREFHLFLLLSGSRPDAIKRARLEHLDLRRRPARCVPLANAETPGAIAVSLKEGVAIAPRDVPRIGPPGGSANDRDWPLSARRVWAVVPKIAADQFGVVIDDVTRSAV